MASATTPLLEPRRGLAARGGRLRLPAAPLAPPRCAAPPLALRPRTRRGRAARPRRRDRPRARGALAALFVLGWVCACLPSTLVGLACGFVLGWRLGALASWSGKLLALARVLGLARAPRLGAWIEARVLAPFALRAGCARRSPPRRRATALALRAAYLPIALQNSARPRCRSGSRPSRSRGRSSARRTRSRGPRRRALRAADVARGGGAPRARRRRRARGRRRGRRAAARGRVLARAGCSRGSRRARPRRPAEAAASPPAPSKAGNGGGPWTHGLAQGRDA